jgi:hypothetical protein
MPAIVFFTEPKRRADILTLPLNRVFESAGELTDELLNEFFRGLAAVLDGCAQDDDEVDRLQCLRRGASRRWPEGNRWRDRVRGVGTLLETSTVRAGSVAAAISGVVTLVNTIPH